MENILEIKNLTVKFGHNIVLDNVSFSVEKGRRIAIIGPNGAGKTTLFRALMNFVPYSGEIIWHKEQKIGYIPQRFDMDVHLPLTVYELFLSYGGIINFWLPNKKETDRIKNSLAHVHAAHLMDRKIARLSGGELQRVLIAYALYQNPSLLLFDEPTTGIDVEGEATVYNLINHLAKEFSLTVLFISHDLNVVYQYVDDVICLNKKMVCFGMPQKVLTTEKLQELYGKDVEFYEHRHN